ncbi:MAG: ATP-binding cassette domain-containing protein, partial [Pseudomonadota bacterium]
MGTDTLLTLEDLSIRFGDPQTGPTVVDRAGFTLARGETLAIVGESGSGKTLTGKALIGLLPQGASVTSGKATMCFEDGSADLLTLPREAMRQRRGRDIAMIFQEPLSAFSPLHTTGRQISEVLRIHGVEGREARERTL